MYNNWDYPAGADNKEAPWNQTDIPERVFDVTVCQVLSKDTKVITDDYIQEVDDEECCTYANTEDTNWQEAYAENDLHTPIQLITLFRKYLKSNLEQGLVFGSSAYTQQLIHECDGWIEDETVIDRY